ncbi:MAG: hypothetical protein FJX22_02825 [Alphaproteobacteria bacterium]|nr:hypothetical protein [Alphaproteobacteria bacterium]
MSNSLSQGLGLAPWRVLAAAFSLGWREESKQGAMIIVRCVLLLAICAIWYRIWLATDLGAIALPFAVNVKSLISYLLIAQWVVFTVGHRYRDVADVVQSGRVYSLLSRPIPYWQYSLATIIGSVAWMMVVMGATAVVGGLWLTGGMPFLGWQIPLLLLVLPMGVMAWMLMQMMIGMAAAWLGNVTPLFWIAQKMMFVFGGLMLPLFFYPGWWQKLAWLTPFPVVFHLAAAAATGQTVLAWWQILLIQLLWLLILFRLMLWVYAAAEKRLMAL